MDPRSPRILVIYPYPSIDTNPCMAFLLESLAARRVAVDVLLEQSPQFRFCDTLMRLAADASRRHHRS